MHTISRLVLSSACAAAIVCASTAISNATPDREPGYVDFGKIASSSSGQYVNIELPTGLMKFAAKLSSKKDPEAAAMLGSIKHVRVNVVTLDEANRDEILGRITTVRKDLQSQGWDQIVTVREQPKGDDVQIFAKMNGEDSIDGLVVTVISDKREVVLVNIVGSIKADQVGALADHLGIQPLKNIKLVAAK